MSTSSRIRRHGALVLALIGFTAAGCTSDTERIPEIDGEFDAEPKVYINADPPSGLTSTTVLKGNGSRIGRNDLAVVQLSSFPWTENDAPAEPEFSSHRLESEVLLSAAEFAAIAPGNEEALIGKTEGSRVALFVPPGAGGTASAEAETDDKASGKLHVIDITDRYAAASTVPGTMSVPDDPALPEVTAPGGRPRVSIPDSDPPDELEVIELIEGDGPEIASGDRVVTQFTGTRWDNKKAFDSTWEHGAQPTPFSLGLDRVVPAWDEGLIGRTVGSRVLIVAPPGTAYGSEGNPKVGIPPDTTLVYVIDLLGRH